MILLCMYGLNVYWNETLKFNWTFCLLINEIKVTYALRLTAVPLNINVELHVNVVLNQITIK